MTQDTQKKQCFVIGPIGSPGTDLRRHADWLLYGIIKPVFQENFLNFSVTRADEIVEPGSINAQVLNRLWEADLVIADMSFENGNAFYELAIAHIHERPTIHMVREGDTIPFDVAPYRALRFKLDEYKDLEQARSELQGFVDEATKPDAKIDNPVKHARGVFELIEQADAPTKVLTDELRTLRAQVRRLEDRVNKSYAPPLDPTALFGVAHEPGKWAMLADAMEELKNEPPKHTLGALRAMRPEKKDSD